MADRLDFGKGWSNEVLQPQIKNIETLGMPSNSIFPNVNFPCRIHLKEYTDVWEMLDDK